MSPCLEGGCLCGAIRYRLTAKPFDAGYCHCRICQRASGAPVLAFATIPLEAMVVTRGEPARRRSSDFGERWFCRDCGAALAMHVDHQPDTIDFTIASLDEPGAVAPGFHIWRVSRISWFETADSLPRQDRFRVHGMALKPTPAAVPDTPRRRVPRPRNRSPEAWLSVDGRAWRTQP